MGTPVSVIKEKHRENEAMANDALNALVTMSNKNLEMFKLEAFDPNNMKIPVSVETYSTESIQCEVAENAEAIGKFVTDTIGDIVSGNFIQAIGNSIAKVIGGVLGSFTGNESSRKTYFVGVGSIGGVFRVDTYVWAYQFQSEALSTITRNVVCSAVVVCSVDTLSPKVTRNAVRNLMQQSYDIDPTELRALFDEVWGEIQKDRQEAGFVARSLAPAAAAPASDGKEEDQEV